MKIIKTFEHFNLEELLQPDFEEYLPKNITILKQTEMTTPSRKKSIITVAGETKSVILERKFNLGNIMRNANMTQTIYTADKRMFGQPDEMSVDIYYYNINYHRKDSIKLKIDIIYGDLAVSEFTLLPPDKVEVVEYTSYHSNFDRSNTLFALSDDTISLLCGFFNKIDGFKLSPEHLGFLSYNDNFVISKKQKKNHFL